jgi:hypothetical protein
VVTAPGSSQFVLVEEPLERGRVHQARRVRIAGAQFVLLQRAVAAHGGEIGHLEHDQHVELGEHLGVVGAQRVVDVAAPDEVRVLGGLQRIDRLRQRRFVLRRSAEAPALEQQHLERALDPLRLGRAVVDRLVEPG